MSHTPSTPILRRPRSTGILLSPGLQQNDITRAKCPLCPKFLQTIVEDVHKHWLYVKSHKIEREIFQPETRFCTYGTCSYNMDCSHEAFAHFTSHFRLRPRDIPKWMHPDAVATYFRKLGTPLQEENVTFFDYPDPSDDFNLENTNSNLNFNNALEGYDDDIDIQSAVINPPRQILALSPMLRNFPSNIDYSSLSEAQKRKLDALECLDFNPTDAEYKTNVENRLRKGKTVEYKTLKSLRGCLRNFFKGFLDINILVLPVEETPNGNVNQSKKIHYMDLRQIIHRWICDELILRIVRYSYQTHTAPFLENIATSIQREPLEYSGSFNGSEWLSILKRTCENFWKPEIEGLDVKEDVLILHLAIFWDGLQKYRGNNNDSAQILMVNVLEVSPTFRWKNGIHAIAPLFIIDSHDNPFINKNILPLYTDQSQDLAKGVDMYCGPLGKIIKVFAYVNCLIGDHPGRASILGLKGHLAKYPCQQCNVEKDTFKEACLQNPSLHNNFFQPRDPTIMANKLLNCEEDQLVSLEADHISANFISELLKWPGFEIPTSVSADIFHSEFHGDLKRHFLKFVICIAKPLKPGIFKLISIEYNNFVRSSLVKGSKICKFDNEANFCRYSGMTIYNIIRFSVLVMEKIVFANLRATDEIKNQLKEDIQRLRDHVDYVVMLSSKSIKSSDLDVLKERIFNVHFTGKGRYSPLPPSRNARTVTAADFISINSHSTYHYPPIVRRFGPCYTFGALAYESLIGFIRRSNDKHRSRHKSEVTVLKRFYEEVFRRDLDKSCSKYRFKETTGEVYRIGSGEFVKEIITSSGLSIKKNRCYLIDILGSLYIVKVAEMSLKPLELFDIQCEKLFKATEVPHRPILNLTNLEPSSISLTSSLFVKTVKVLEANMTRSNSIAFF